MRKFFVNSICLAAGFSFFLAAGCKTTAGRSGLKDTSPPEDFSWALDTFINHCKNGLQGPPEQKLSFEKTLKVLGVNSPNDCEAVRSRIEGATLDLSGETGLNLALLLKLSPRALILRNTGITSTNLLRAITYSQKQHLKDACQYLDLSDNQITYDKDLFIALFSYSRLQFVSLAGNKVSTLGDRELTNDYQTFLELPDIALDFSRNPLVINETSFKNGGITSMFGKYSGGAKYLNVSGIDKLNMDSLVGSSITFLVAVDVKSIKAISSPIGVLSGLSMFPNINFMVTHGSKFENPADIITMLNNKATWMKNASAFLTDNTTILTGVNVDGKTLTDEIGFTSSCSADIAVKADDKSRITSVSCPGTLTSNLWGTIANPTWNLNVNDPSTMVVPVYK